MTVSVAGNAGGTLRQPGKAGHLGIAERADSARLPVAATGPVVPDGRTERVQRHPRLTHREIVWDCAPPALRGTVVSLFYRAFTVAVTRRTGLLR